ncbi:MAG: YbaB/EbfC family nucleoid-associated protein [Acidobacteriaceae bacterium]
MFDKFKDLYNLKKQAQEMQKKMGSEEVAGFSSDGTFSVRMNGNQEMLEVSINEGVELSRGLVSKNVQEAYSDAQKQLQTILIEKFKDTMGGMPGI